jgi:hypothetical protein
VQHAPPLVPNMYASGRLCVLTSAASCYPAVLVYGGLIDCMPVVQRLLTMRSTTAVCWAEFASVGVRYVLTHLLSRVVWACSSSLWACSAMRIRSASCNSLPLASGLSDVGQHANESTVLIHLHDAL